MTAPTPEPASQPVVPPRPEPVLLAAKQAGYIAGLIGSVATALGAYGAISGQSWAVDTAAVVTAIAPGLAGVLPRITAQGARAQVTPLSSPESVDGAPLVQAQSVSRNMGPDAA